MYSLTTEIIITIIIWTCDCRLFFWAFQAVVVDKPAAIKSQESWNLEEMQTVFESTGASSGKCQSFGCEIVDFTTHIHEPEALFSEIPKSSPSIDEIFRFLEERCAQDVFSEESSQGLLIVQRLPPGLLSPPMQTPFRSICQDSRYLKNAT